MAKITIITADTPAKRNMVAASLHANQFRKKIEANKKAYNRKEKHRGNRGW